MKLLFDQNLSWRLPSKLSDPYPNSQLHQAAKDFDEVISPGDADFVLSGLKEESLIRLGFLVVVPRNNIAGSIGSISSERHKRLLEKLSKYLVR